MNRLDALISQQCPDGVPYMAIGEISKLVRGTRVTKSELVDGAKYPVISGGTGFMGFLDKFNREAQTITIAQYGTAGFVAWRTERFWANDICFCVEVNPQLIRSKFLYYLLSGMQNYLFGISNRTAVPYSIEARKIEATPVPVPPLPVQDEIVRILDAFTELEAELEAELKARSSQLASIKDSLFHREPQTEEYKELGDLADLWQGRTKAPLTSSNYVSVENLVSNFGGRIDSRSVPATAAISFQPQDILIGNIRPYLKKIWFADKEGGSSADVITVRLKPGFETKVLHRYLYHVLASDRFFDFSMAHAKGAKMPRGSKDATFKFLVPLPPISTQNQIVRLLDQLETLISDTEFGLPAEITARRKQYEYYRDQLLAFTEA